MGSEMCIRDSRYRSKSACRGVDAGDAGDVMSAESLEKRCAKRFGQARASVFRGVGERPNRALAM